MVSSARVTKPQPGSRCSSMWLFAPFQAGLLAGLDRRHAHLQTFFAVMAALDDTNLAHRGGLEGLRFAQDRARIFLAAGGAHRPDAAARAGAIHREFVARRLSPGGTADVLAAACLIGRVCGWA